MARHFANQPVYLTQLDIRHPDFAHQCLVWASQTHLEIQELVATAKKEIANSRELMAEADRIIARR